VRTEKAQGDTLALMNVALLALGKEQLPDLPRARPGQSSDCLYARGFRSIGVTSVGGGGTMTFSSERVAQFIGGLWNAPTQGVTVQAPPQFANVIGRFDNNDLPAYNPGS